MNKFRIKKNDIAIIIGSVIISMAIIGNAFLREYLVKKPKCYNTKKIKKGQI